MRWILPALIVSIACGDEQPEGPPPDVREDARVLAEILADDPTPRALSEVDDAVMDDLPARAAELLESGAIPAARQRLALAEAAAVQTTEGRLLRNEVVAAMRERVAALEEYRAVLARGDVTDLRLAAALRKQRHAEGALAEASAAVEMLIAR